jgi:hypothetical protein
MPYVDFRKAPIPENKGFTTGNKNRQHEVIQSLPAYSVTSESLENSNGCLSSRICKGIFILIV